MAKSAKATSAKVVEKPHDPRDVFIRRLAEYLAGDQGYKSIELQMGKESAKEWSRLRGATPIFGYPTVDEAEAILKRFLLRI